MAGRIGIDDVAPVVSAGRYPAKAVVGEMVPVRATVWREGHDAVSATLVVRYHGTAYPQLAEGPVQDQPAQPVPIENRGHPGDQDQAAGHFDGVGSEPRTCSTASSAPTASGCGRSGSTAGATRSRPGGGPSPPNSTQARARAELSNDLIIGARLLERAATGLPRSAA